MGMTGNLVKKLDQEPSKKPEINARMNLGGQQSGQKSQGCCY